MYPHCTHQHSNLVLRLIYGQRKTLIKSSNEVRILGTCFNISNKPGCGLAHVHAQGCYGRTFVSSSSNKVVPNSTPVPHVNNSSSHFRIAKTLARYAWPPIENQKDDERPLSPEEINRNVQMRRNVKGSLGLLVGAKLVNVTVPFLFKHVVDSIPSDIGKQSSAQSSSEAVSTVSNSIDTITATAEAASSAVPEIVPWVLLSYSIARATSMGMNEYRNFIFSRVSQNIIKSIGSKVYRDVLEKDYKWHVQKNTGAIQTVLARGTKSISGVLQAMVFHLIPTSAEIVLVLGIIQYQFGFATSAICAGTMGVYATYTILITQWRTQFRVNMNKKEQKASKMAVESMLNFESIWYNNAVDREVKRYSQTLEGYQQAALKAQSSLSLLNFGQGTFHLNKRHNMLFVF